MIEINIQKLRDLIKSDKKIIIQKNSSYLYHGIYIPAFKDVNPIISILANLLWNTPIPLRSGLQNEYQTFGKVTPEKIIGIQIRLDKLLQCVPVGLNISESEYIYRIIQNINIIFDKFEEKNIIFQ